MRSVRLIKHEAIPQCGSFEVRYSDGRPSPYFYWDDLPSRRLRPDLVTSDVALKQAKALARAERDRPDQWSSTSSRLRATTSK
jgi:hypothetical protein